jgi:hypothetical protein
MPKGTNDKRSNKTNREGERLKLSTQSAKSLGTPAETRKNENILAPTRIAKTIEVSEAVFESASLRAEKKPN